MNIRLDFRSGIPIYVQIVDQIKHQIASGQLSPGAQLPTVRQLASDLRVNFNTIARAYRLLDEAGVISTQQGRGTYVLSQPDDRASQRLRQEALEGLARRFLAQAAHLEAPPNEVMAIIQKYVEGWIHQGSPPTLEQDEE